MKKRIILFTFLISALFTAKAEGDLLLDVDFTRDSIHWIAEFPEMSWNAGNTDLVVSGINGLSIDGLTFRGAFGKFNENYARPIDLADPTVQHIYAFRIANNGNSYIEFPEVSNAGLLTVHCSSGNASQSAIFYLEKQVGENWERIATLIAPPHGNQNRDAIISHDLQSDEPVKLRLYGASKNLHVFSIELQSYDASDNGEVIRLVALPDTQTYVAEFPHIFDHQTAWCVNNADSIDFVIHLGDITNANSVKHWESARASMSLMDNIVPYTFCPGNHDIGDGKGDSGTRVTTRMNQYLPYNIYKNLTGFGGVYEANRMDNSWHTFSQGDYDFLIVSIEFAPRDGVLEWANAIIQAHPNHNVIINTHAYMYSDNKRMSASYGHKWTPSTYGLFNDVMLFEGEEMMLGANDGEEMWDKMVKLHPNMLMVLSGHVLNSGAGRLVSTGDNGNKVYQMLSNYQKGVTNTVDGGNGFLRIIDVLPETSQIKVRSFSPYIHEFKTEPAQQFTYENVDLIKRTSSGVNRFEELKNVKLWSADKTLFIVNSSSEKINATVFDTLGRVVRSYRGIETSLTVPMTAGYYIVKLESESARLVQKMIVQ